ncbi:MAG: hypothetical protein FIB07_02035 [Candidatus Methanoperedens sp.]|nr:hypothetical protein [Candidatus Methanoperedens sp.]
MTMVSMIMAINDVAQEIPLENSWDGLGLLILGLPLLSCTVSFLVIYKFTKNITRSALWAIIGFIGAFFVLSIPINSEGDILQSIINPGGVYAAIIYFVVMTTFIGLIGAYIQAGRAY